EEKLKLVDFVMELLDARAPYSSQNPMLNDIIKDKPKMMLLMKSDLADKRETDRWIDFYEAQGNAAVSVDVNNKPDINRVIQQAQKISDTKQVALQQKAFKTDLSGR